MSTDYDDIIHLPHPVSAHHPPMPMKARAAQFAPFAALSGHREALNESARYTEPFTPDAYRPAHLDNKLRYLLDRLGEGPAVAFTCFVPDRRKAGGLYATFSGRVCKWNENARTLTLDNGHVLPIDTIVDIQGEGLPEQT